MNAFKTLDTIGDVYGRHILVREDLNVPIHDGLVHPREHFDHMLYCQGGTVEGMRSDSAASKHVAIGKTKGIVLGNAPLQKVPLDGYLLNKDYWVASG